MLSLSVNPGRPPKNEEWSYQKHDIVFTDKSFPELLAKVTAALESELLTVDEITQSIFAQMHAQSAWLFTGTPEEGQASEHQRDFRKYVSRVRAAEYTDIVTAKNRMMACRQCPYNEVADMDVACNRRVLVLTKGQHFPQIGMCRIHRHHNAIAALMKTTPMAQNCQPPFCWIA